MSADNSICIFESDGPEYRIGEIRRSEDNEFIIKNRHNIFVQDEVYYDLESAQVAANSLEDTLDIVEYGQAKIKMSGKF